MTVTIIRIDKNRDHPYVMMDKRLVEDATLSWKDKGLMAYLLSRPDDWEIRVADLVRCSPGGENAVRSGLRELERHGYLVRRQCRDAATGRFTGVVLTVHEEPVPLPSGDTPPCDSPPPDDPQMECPQMECPQMECPQMDLPHTDNPHTDEPHAGYPHTENRTRTDTEFTKTESTKTEKTRIDDDDVPPLPPHDGRFTTPDRSRPAHRTALGFGASRGCDAPGESRVSQGQGTSGAGDTARGHGTLYRQEIGGYPVAMIHDERVGLVPCASRDPERWRAAFRASNGDFPLAGDMSPPWSCRASTTGWGPATWASVRGP